MNPSFVDQVIALSQQAGDAILSIYHSHETISTHKKADDSPVTAADIAAHNILLAGLQTLLPDTPVLSEEAHIPSFHERSQWQRYWLIDPLDGTKEFIQRNDEFTVNIALIDRGKPVLGVVYVPASHDCYWGGAEIGAYKLSQGKTVAIHTRTLSRDAHDNIHVVASRRHGTDKLSHFENALNRAFHSVTYHAIGSSLKLCLIAEGKADIYPRFAPTCEWDTAAAHAVVEGAGGVLQDLQFGHIGYNGKTNMLNPYFYVFGDETYPWQSLLSKIPIE